jgi:hypothetical protein
MIAPPDNFNGCGEGRTIEIRAERGRHTLFRLIGKIFFFLFQNQPRKEIFRKKHYLFSTGFYKVPYNLIGDFVEACRVKKGARTTVKLSALFEKYRAEGGVPLAI